MEPAWHQVMLAAAGTFAAIAFGVGTLIRQMTGGYGSIIKSLQSQNMNQQTQITEHGDLILQLRKEVRAADSKCDERIRVVEEEWKRHKMAIDDNHDKLEVLTKRINGTPVKE